MVSSNNKRTFGSMSFVKYVTVNLNCCGLLLFLHKLKGNIKSVSRVGQLLASMRCSWILS